MERVINFGEKRIKTEKMKVKKLKYNWHQVGSTESRDGAGEDYDWFEVGQNGVVTIQEWLPSTDIPLNYLAVFEDGRQIRIFNPNIVEYTK